MPVLSTRWKLALVGFLIYGAAVLYFGGDVAGQRKAAAQEKEKPAEGEKAGPVDEKGTPLKQLYFGTAACAGGSCHEKGQKADPPLLCRCDELDRWKEHDKHADAYKVLLGPRGRQMTKILGYEVTKAKECLNCHATSIADPATQHKSFRFDEGVSCVICHGAYARWVGEHSLVLSRETFRVLSRAEKEKHYGMRDLWNPVKRTRLCASCHIGNLNEGKFVTHAMYAAGHPPLPGFEIATFSNEMPRHWEYLAKKPPQVQKLLGYNGKEQEQAKLVLVGAAISLAQSMNLLQMQAETCEKAVKDDDKALDYSNFDCYACHHDLKSPSWRQKRGYAGKPGRVPMRPWSTELVKLGLRVVGGKPGEASNGEKKFQMLLEDVHKAFDARPFGDPKKVAAAAEAVKKWSEALAQKLNETPIDSKTAKALLKEIPDLFQGGKDKPLLLDYDSARQVAWSFETIYQELIPDPKSSKAVQTALDALGKEVKLRLPKGRISATATESAIERDLGENLKRLNDYDPEKFRKLLSELSTALGGKTP